MKIFVRTWLRRIRATSWRDWILWAHLTLWGLFWVWVARSWFPRIPSFLYWGITGLWLLAVALSFTARWRWLAATVGTGVANALPLLIFAFDLGSMDYALHLWAFTLSFLALYVPFPWNILATSGQIGLILGLLALLGQMTLQGSLLGTLAGMVLLAGIFITLEYLIHRYRWLSGQLSESLRSLDEQRRFLQSVIDAIEAPFYVIDVKDYRIVLANKRARELGIRTEGTQAPTTCYALTHHRDTPCSGEEHPCPLQMVLEQGRPAEVEHVHYRDDGTPYVAEVHAYPVFDAEGRIRYMVEYSIDITARRKAEARLRLLEKALEHSAHGVVITNKEGVIEYVNPAFTQMTGYTAEEALGKTPAILKSGKHDRAYYQRLWNTILSGKVWEGRIINRRKDGSLYYEDQTIAPVRDENGDITHFVAVKRDVTPRIQMEEALKRARRQAEKASQFKSYLMAALGHDLRTPLQSILGYAELLLMSKKRLPKDLADMLDAIYRAASQIRFFADDLLHYGQMEQTGLQLHPRPMNIRAFQRELRRIFEPFVEEKNLQYSYEVSPDFPEVIEVDTTWFPRAVMNLVSNAIKFTPEGGEVRVRFWKPDEHTWAVAVEDSGPGVPEDLKERIFEPFVTGGISTRGVGLGLSIVRSVVEAMGGTIEVENRPEGGARFVMRFPLNEKAAKSQAPDSAGGHQAKAGR